MKKLLAMLMACMLLCGLALADGDGGIATPANYEELLAAMQNSRYREISLRVKDFGWPTEEVTLDLTQSNAFISIVGEFTFPENVTVNCAQLIGTAGAPGDVIVNGPWNCLSDTGMIYHSNGNVIYNGPVTFTCDKRVRLSNSNANFVFNGPMQLNAIVSANGLTLGDGVVIEGERYLEFSETIAVPEGEATINVPLHPAPSNDHDQPTLAGDMTVKELVVSERSFCIITAQSDVTVDKLNVREGGQLIVDGTVELPVDSRHNGTAGTLQLNETGTLIMNHSTRLGNEDGGKITGTGTLDLRANVAEYEKGVRHPKVFGANSYEGLPADFVDETVKIVKNWKE